MRLLVNADDYGLTVPVSLGIIEGMRHGIISSTSAIVPCDCFEEMAVYAQEHGVKRIGLHSMLTVLRPTLPAEEVPTLVGEDGRFFGRRDFMERDISVDEARAELENQIRLFLQTGLELDHIDTHHGFVMKNDEFFVLFCDLAQKYDVPLRNEVSRMEPGAAKPYLQKLGQLGIRVVDEVYFNHGTPHHTVEDIEAFLTDALGRCETVEIGCHPGHSDAYLRSLSVLNDDREVELDVMCDQALREFIVRNGIEVIGYDQL